MSYDFWQAVANTPWWVYLLFAYLMYAGYLATKPQVQHIRNFYILPPIIIACSVLGMTTLITVTPHNTLYYVLMLPVGMALGWLQCRQLQVKAVAEKKLLQLQGTWSISIIVFIIFCVKYYYGYELSFDPNLFKGPGYSLALMIFYGLFTGIVIGRMIFMRRILKTGPFIAESELVFRQPAH